MNERAVPDAPLSETPGKLVPFPMVPPSGQKSGLGLRTHWLLGTVLSLLVTITVAVAWWVLGADRAVHYTTVPVTRGAVIRAATATGTVNPELTIIVGTYVSGVIQELYCDYNTAVKKGQVCAKIDPRPYQTVVDQNKANLAVAKAQLEKDKASVTYAKLGLDRADKLVQTMAVSQDTLDNAKSAYDQAKAQVEFDEATIGQRQAALDGAQVDLDYADIVSPVDGIVVSRNVTMGQTVAASFQTPTLFLIATDLTKMEVDTNVSESDIGGIKEGDKCTFTVDAFPKRTFEGVVSQVRQSPQTVQNVVTYDIVASANNSDLALKPGMTAAALIVVDQRSDVVRVPDQAIRYVPSAFSATAPVNPIGPPEGAALPRGNGPNVGQIWILRDGQPVSIPVVLGLDDDSFTEIASGDVKPGDQVIAAEQSATSSQPVMPQLRF